MSQQNNQEEMKKQLAEMQSRIQDLKAKAAQANEQRKAELEKHIHHLNEQQETMQKQLNEIQEASEEAFDEIKSGFQSAWEKINQRFNQTNNRSQ